MDPNPFPNSPAGAPGPGPAPGQLAVWTQAVLFPSRLDRRDAFRIAGWSWDAVGEQPLFEEDLSTEPRDGRTSFLLAIAAARPVGMLAIRRLEYVAEFAVVVDPAHRRRGVGRHLVHSIPRGLNAVAFAGVENCAGQLFLRAMGFDGRRCPRAPLIRFKRS